MNLKNWKLNALIVGSLILMAVLCAPVIQAADQRMMVRVAEAFEVNGQLYDAAKLTLRQTGDYNPAATINEIWVGDRCLGMLLAREVDTDRVADTDSFVFTRDADGTLVLIGVSFRGQPVRELYQYDVAHDGRWIGPGDSATGTLLASK